MTIQEIFLKGVWSGLPSEENTLWVSHLAQIPFSSKPLGDYGAIVARMLSAGLSEYEIARFAKIVAYEAVHYMCYHIDDPDASRAFSEDENLEWGLFRVEGRRPGERIGGLHETIMSLDPSEREMRPRENDRLPNK